MDQIVSPAQIVPPASYYRKVENKTELNACSILASSNFLITTNTSTLVIREHESQKCKKVCKTSLVNI